MSLSERLMELKKARMIIRRLQLPNSLNIDRSYSQVSQKHSQIASVGKVDYDALLTKLRLVAKSRAMSTLSQREMRLSASCLFDGEMRLADDHSFLAQFLDAQRSIRSRVAIRRLIHAYCSHFDPSHSGIRQISMFLREAVASIPSSARWVWPEMHRQFGLFDPTQAPARLAELTIKSPNPRKKLEEIGLGGQLIVSGLSANVFLSSLKLTQRNLLTDPKLEDVVRVIAWVQDDDGKTYYSAHRGAVANTLLLPWTEQIPDQNIRQRTQSFLLDKLGDPRIDRGAWLGVEDAARDVMIRWLAQATLEQFLKVVDRVAAKHQWDYRRAFWNAYIEKRVVANAWVAFGSSGAQVARRIAENSADSLMRRFATLGGSGADQAVLLLSIGDLIIADWSHNGRLRIWRRGNPSAPDLNLPSYVASDLRSDSEFDTVHLPPDGWQGKAEAFIRKHTGIRLLETEYMPRRMGK
jgi:EH_Signature domain